MIDHIGEQLAGRGFGLHARDQLAARRAQELDLDERKALVERIDDRLLALGDVGRVEDELAFLPGGLDQFRRAELRVRRHRQAEQAANPQRESADQARRRG